LTAYIAVNAGRSARKPRLPALTGGSDPPPRCPPFTSVGGYSATGRPSDRRAEHAPRSAGQPPERADGERDDRQRVVAAVVRRRPCRRGSGAGGASDERG
jgi:hypothetical protein